MESLMEMQKFQIEALQREVERLNEELKKIKEIIEVYE